MGASRRDILGLILGEGIVHALIGLLLGLGASALLMRWVRAYLYEASPVHTRRWGPPTHPFAPPCASAVVHVAMLQSALHGRCSGEPCYRPRE
jgi:ABC-type lipoprotein release transport system permease subunit